MKRQTHDKRKPVRGTAAHWANVGDQDSPARDCAGILREALPPRAHGCRGRWGLRRRGERSGERRKPAAPSSVLVVLARVLVDLCSCCCYLLFGLFVLLLLLLMMMVVLLFMCCGVVCCACERSCSCLVHVHVLGWSSHVSVLLLLLFLSALFDAGIYLCPYPRKQDRCVSGRRSLPCTPSRRWWMCDLY